MLLEHIEWDNIIILAMYSLLLFTSIRDHSKSKIHTAYVFLILPLPETHTPTHIRPNESSIFEMHFPLTESSKCSSSQFIHIYFKN